MVRDYAKVVLKDRYDVLIGPITKNRNEYEQLSMCYPKILELAQNDYNITFIDVDKRMPIETQQKILKLSDIIIINTNQGLNNINDLIELRRSSEFFNSKRVMLLLGRYDKFSKYNAKNIMR